MFGLGKCSLDIVRVIMMTRSHSCQCQDKSESGMLLMLLNYLKELSYLFSKYQQLYLHVRKILWVHFFLPFLKRREIISIPGWVRYTELPRIIFCSPGGLELLRPRTLSGKFATHGHSHEFFFHTFVQIYPFRFFPFFSEQLGTVIGPSLLAEKRRY